MHTVARMQLHAAADAQQSVTRRCCLRRAGPDFGEFLTGSELVAKYSVEAPHWKVREGGRDGGSGWT